jgi:hypothetical protein
VTTMLGARAPVEYDVRAVDGGGRRVVC